MIQMKDIFVLVHIDEELPPEKENGLSDSNILTFNSRKVFLGQDTYNHKLKRWLISRDTAKYWLKKVST